NGLPPPIFARARSQNPSRVLQAIDERHHARFVDAELARELDLGDARIRAGEGKRAEHAWTDLASGNGACEIAPERDLSATDVVAEQRGENVCVDRSQGPRLAGLLLFAVGLALIARNVSL